MWVFSKFCLLVCVAMIVVCHGIGVSSKLSTPEQSRQNSPLTLSSWNYPAQEKFTQPHCHIINDHSLRQGGPGMPQYLK